MSLFPILGGYCEGFLANYFGIWSHYLIAFLLPSIIFQVLCLVVCFLIKHQGIARVVIHNVVPDTVYHCFLFLLFSLPILTFFLFREAGMTREEQTLYVSTVYPNYRTQFEKQQNYAVYKFNTQFLILIIEAAIIFFFSTTVFVFITVDMIKMLKRLQKKVSAVSFKRYQSAVISLVAQFGASVVMLTPLTFFVWIAISGMENAQDLVLIPLFICALHSIINALVLIFSNPQYRDFQNPNVSIQRCFSGVPIPIKDPPKEYKESEALN
uniref:Serpentine Receptor, class H n=1 Tax=Caenorhabditis tropicalis TaxID=1561998 RepID=A0A1I7UKY3_9PELO